MCALLENFTKSISLYAVAVYIHIQIVHVQSITFSVYFTYIQYNNMLKNVIPLYSITIPILLIVTSNSLHYYAGISKDNTGSLSKKIKFTVRLITR